MSTAKIGVIGAVIIILSPAAAIAWFILGVVVAVSRRWSS